MARVNSIIGLNNEWWPLSFVQERQLLADELATDSGGRRAPTHIPIAIRIRGKLDIQALESSLNTVIRRHSGLAATYHRTNTYAKDDRRMMLMMFARSRLFVPGLWAQKVHADATLTISHRQEAGADDDEQLGLAARREAASPVSTDVAPLMRATVVTFGNEHHLLVMTVPHLAIDGWSAAVLRAELMAIYRSKVIGTPLALPRVIEHSGQYALRQIREFAAGDFRAAAEYWKDEWRHASESLLRHEELPCAITETDRSDRSVNVVKAVVPNADARRIRQLGSEYGVTPYVFFRSAFTALLRRYTGRTCIAFGANFANRRSAGSARLIAACAHPHVISVDVSRGSTAVEICQHISKRLAEAQRHEAVPEAALPLCGVPCKDNSNARVTFDAWPPRAHDHGDPMEPFVVLGSRQWVDLDVRFRDCAECFELYIEYRRVRYSGAGVLRMLDDLVGVVSAFATAPHARYS